MKKRILSWILTVTMIATSFTNLAITGSADGEACTHANMVKHDAAFYKCTSLTKVELKDNVTSIGGYAFRGCTKLNDVTLSENLETIGEGAFYACTALTEIDIPASVTTIGNYCFPKTTTVNRVSG